MALTRKNLVWLVILGVFLIAASLYWYLVIFNNSVNTANLDVAINSQNQAGDKNLEQIKSALLRQIGEWRQYGQWPLAAVALSENRGNPFVKK